jgi:hypothetical protein
MEDVFGKCLGISKGRIVDLGLGGKCKSCISTGRRVEVGRVLEVAAAGQPRQSRMGLTSGIVKLSTINANPVIHNISQKAHLHPFASTANPATIGPRVGPAAHAKSYNPIE